MDLDLKALRAKFQLSQVDLAHESGVSLPTIQNIEAGKGNPTLEVLEKLCLVLGLQFEVVTPPFDVGNAVAFGVPLTASASGIPVNKKTLKRETRKWLQLLQDEKLSERDELAIVSFLKGMKDHYPSFYQDEISTSLFEEKIRKFSNHGRVIKLRRIALAGMSKYL